MTTAIAASILDHLNRWAPRRAMALCLAAGVAAGVLSACGGGTQVEKFVPTKMVSFGDENSVLTAVLTGGTPPYAYGQKYTVNSVSDTKLPTVGTTLLHYDCFTHNKLWIQVLAASYGLGYNSGSLTEPQKGCPADSLGGAVTYAEPHATVSGSGGKSVRDQVNAHRAELDSNTLVTVLAGQSDIVVAYQAVLSGSSSADQARVGLVLKGQELGGIINEITATGARVAYVTVPDLSRSPLALKSGGDPALMSGLVKAFNNGLTGAFGVKNDGHQSAVIQFFDEVTAMSDRPVNYGLTDGVTAWCTSARQPNGAEVLSTLATTPATPNPDFVLYCNSLTGPPGVSELTYLWADDQHLGPAAHATLGALAYTRVNANPL